MGGGRENEVNEKRKEGKGNKRNALGREEVTGGESKHFYIW